MLIQLVAVIGVFLLVFIIYKLMNLEKKQANQGQNEILLEWLKTHQGNVDQNLNHLQSQLQKQSQDFNTRLSESSNVIREVARERGVMIDIVLSSRGIQQRLASPKLRGNLGESILYNLLAQVLPNEMYRKQFSFKDGMKVDAVIMTDRGLIPIDAKFALDQFAASQKITEEEARLRALKIFQNDFKKHIKDVHMKYIRPQEGTVDFALIYVPSEGVYHYLCTECPEVLDFAQSQQIQLVSPHNFYYFLRIILMGFQEKRIAQSAKQIMNALSSIGLEASKFTDELSTAHRHVAHAKTAMDGILIRFQGLSGKIDQAQQIAEPDEIASSATSPVLVESVSSHNSETFDI